MERAVEDETSKSGERADSCKTSNRDERATEQKTPSPEERAITNEKPTLLERAMTGKKPEGSQRATREEKPTVPKRATFHETPNGRERAKNEETPSDEERAIHREAPTSVERANIAETPTAEERAMDLETPILDERATEDKATSNQERTLPDGGTPAWSPVRNLVDSYYDLQRLRIAVGHRLSRSPEEMAADEHEPLLLALHKDLERNEKGLGRHLREIAVRHPVGPWLLEIRGIAGVLAAGLLSTFEPEKAPHASSYWAFAGLVPGMKLEKGKKAPYSRGAKTLAWKVADSFMKQRTAIYRPLYDAAKKEYLAREWTKGHAHNAALRRVAKEFLRRFWLVSREASGLPTDEPYAVAILGHTKREDE